MLVENDLILMSVWILVGGKAIEGEGSFKWLNRVKKYERHDKLADLELLMFETSKTMRAGGWF